MPDNLVVALLVILLAIFIVNAAFHSNTYKVRIDELTDCHRLTFVDWIHSCEKYQL